MEEIEKLKEELANIYRFDGTNGSHRYALSVEKENNMNDDRALKNKGICSIIHKLQIKISFN